MLYLWSWEVNRGIYKRTAWGPLILLWINMLGGVYVQGYCVGGHGEKG